MSLIVNGRFCGLRRSYKCHTGVNQIAQKIGCFFDRIRKFDVIENCLAADDSAI